MDHIEKLIAERDAAQKRAAHVEKMLAKAMEALGTTLQPDGLKGLIKIFSVCQRTYAELKEMEKS